MKKAVAITIDEVVHKKTKVLCAENSIKFSNLVEELLKQYLSKERK